METKETLAEMLHRMSREIGERLAQDPRAIETLDADLDVDTFMMVSAYIALERLKNGKVG